MDDLPDMYLNNVWRPNVAITGAEGLPPMSSAGNVVRKSTKIRISMRLSPIQDAKVMESKLREALTANPPYGAKITIEGDHAGSGWCQKDLDEHLTSTLDTACHSYFGSPCASYGMGFAIPFLKELETIYPKTQIVAMGLLGPDSNAHAPNEGINLEYAKKLTCVLGHLVSSFDK
jgi:acetylornithine deacetylase/succinyl-diaminopimelate desuccinylase-like protein